MRIYLARSLQRGIKFDCIAPDGCNGHCCWGAGSVYIFPDDVARIVEFLKMDVDEFLDKHVDVVESTPIHVKYDGNIPVPMFKETGDKAACHFQDGKGRCTVHQARPFQCSGYPFWRMNTKNKESWSKIVAYCPGAAASPKKKGARFYPAAEIRRLVQDEVDFDVAWEMVMAEWKGDYRGYLKNFIADRKERKDKKGKEINPLNV